MELAVAWTISGDTRDRAQRDARDELRLLREHAVEAGRARSRKLIKVSNINYPAGTASYNPAGRLLRDWYMHVYLNTLRSNLGEPAVVIDAQQVEDLARLVRGARPHAEPLRALQAVGVVRDVAVDDANHATVAIFGRVRQLGAERAVRDAPDERFDADPVRVHVTRHWYLRCFEAQLEVATRSQQPLAGVTDAEQELVAQTLASREVRRVIGRDGIPLVTIHHTRLNEIDRALARGDTGVVPPMVVSETQHDPFDSLRKQVMRTWSELTDDRRAQWLRLAGAEPMRIGNSWNTLDGDQQWRLARDYLETHRRDLVDQEPIQPVIRADPATAAQRMFNHRLALGPEYEPKADPPAARLAVEGSERLRQDESHDARLAR